MRVDKDHPEYERLVAAFNAEGNPRILRQGDVKWTWYTDEGKLFFIRTVARNHSGEKSSARVQPDLPRTEPPLK